METPIRYILMPVLPGDFFLPVIKQVAEFTKGHDAILHLLYIGDPKSYQSFFPWPTPKKSPLAETKEKMILLGYWKTLIEDTYHIRVEISVEWGGWRKTLLRFAVSTDADMIALHEDVITKSWLSFYKTPLAYIIEKSPCQVLTLLSAYKDEYGWQQVVIPVTDFIPELRIQAIMKTAVSMKLKIHLVTLASGEAGKRSADFYFLTETLKRFKPAGNIQVECRCLGHSFGAVDSFLHYARSVGADLLMTRMSLTDKEAERVKDLNFYGA